MTKKKGLGKGVAALIGEAEDSASSLSFIKSAFSLALLLMFIVLKKLFFFFIYFLNLKIISDDYY